MNLTQTQLDWLAQKGFQQTDVNQDDIGLYILITSSLDGTQTKMYLPS